MTRKKSQSTKGRSPDMPQPLETLLSGKAGPLPMDSDQQMPPEKPETTAASMPPSERVNSSPFLGGLAAKFTILSLY